MTATLRQILVHLDPTAGSTQRLKVARRIADVHGARLAALYAATPAFIELPYAPEIGPMVAATLTEIDTERREAALKAFDKEMTQPGAMAAWMQTDDVPTAGAFAQQALYADLLVLGQRDRRDMATSAVPPGFVEDVLAASGRPALVLPYVGHEGPIGDTIAIAWKESPESARAVQAALPFLRRASQVHVLAWGEQGAPRLGGVPLDLQGYLELHGVQATWHREGAEPAALGELLLSRVCDLGADLLVMGCYGHSRAREWILGGVSRTMLESMTVPVLMAR